jgi:VanZ family protein
MIDFTACLIGAVIGLALIIVYLALTTPKYPK